MTPEYAGITPYTGGVGVHFSALAPELARRGHDVVLVVACSQAEPVTSFNGMPVIVVPGHGDTAKGLLGRAWRVGKSLDQHGPFDIVFGPEWGGLLSARSHHPRGERIVTNLVTSLRQVRSIEGRSKTTREERSATYMQRALERRQAARSDLVVACSSAILAWTRELWRLRAPALVIPNFIDLEQTRRLSRGQLPGGFPSSPDGGVILYFGRMELRKGVHVLADAMSDVWRQRPATHLVLIGRDSVEGGMLVSEQVIQLSGNHSSQVHFLGVLEPHRLLPAVGRADIVALPSLWENFSIAALETRALGRPLVATSGSGFDDFCSDGDDCVLVPPRDPRALGVALTRLLLDADERSRLGRRAAESGDLYTPGRVTDRLVDAFATVI